MSRRASLLVEVRTGEHPGDLCEHVRAAISGILGNVELVSIRDVTEQAPPEVEPAHEAKEDDDDGEGDGNTNE